MAASPAELRALRDRVGREAYVRACRHAAWEAGDLSYALHEGQLRAREMVRTVHERAIAADADDPAALVKRVLLNIARRWGKTFFFVVFCLELMLKKPGARIPYAAMSETSVREYVEPILRELAEHAPPHLAPREYKGEWIIPAGPGRGAVSRLIVKGCEDKAKANRLRGPAADAFVVDEAGFIPILDYVVRDVAAAQLLTTDGMMLIGSSAPESPEHEFWKFADEAAARGAYMHATVYDNPRLTPKQIAGFAAEVGGEDSPAWLREGLSRRVVDVTKAVYPEWTQAELDAITKPGETIPIVGEIERPEHYDCYVVGDLGFSDLSFILFAYYHFERALLVIEDELVLRRQTSDVIEAEARRKQHEAFGDRKPLVRALEGDALVVASIRKEERIARGEAQRGVAENPDGDEDITRWNQIAFVQMEAAVNAARMRIKRRGVLVHPRCTTLIAHLRGAVWNKNRTSFERIKGAQGHHFDGAAAFAYLVKRLQPNRNPFPPVPHGLSHLTGHRVPPELLRDDRKDRFKRAFQPRRERR